MRLELQRPVASAVVDIIKSSILGSCVLGRFIAHEVRFRGVFMFRGLGGGLGWGCGLGELLGWGFW